MNDALTENRKDTINVTKKRESCKRRGYKNLMNPYSQNKVKVLRMADYFKPTPCAMATYSGDDIYEYASARTGLT